MIDENAAEQIAGLAEVMAACPKLSLIIRGHTDSSGVETENVWLSAIRARSVARTLMDNQIAVDRLTWVGVGSSSPIADNATPEGRRLNRRIEIEAVINSSGE